MLRDIQSWFARRVPAGWFARPPDVSADGEEILVLGELPGTPDDAAGAVREFREATRERRMAIADDAERRFGRKVAWGVVAGGERHLFTTYSVPVMTRLRMPERQVLDTLVACGVARSRSEALAWCVRLVGEHEADWLKELRNALGAVEAVRDKGPKPGEKMT